MPHDLELISTLTGSLAAALVLGFVTWKLRLSPIVGYLAAGVAVGPFTPGFVAHGAIAGQFAELGVILLLFGVGLHFHLGDLLAVRKVVLSGALLQVTVASGLGFLLGRTFGFSPSASLVFGLSVSVASTVVLLRAFSDADLLHTGTGRVAIGWLIVQDLVMVLVLVLLPLVLGDAARASNPGEIALSAAIAAGKVACLVAFTLVVGRRVMPALLAAAARARSRELFTLTVLVLALGIAVGSAKLFGASMALGAFLAGMVVGQSEFATRAASEALPMRDAFAVLFFVSVGMSFDPAALRQNLALVLLTFALVLVVSPLTAVVVALSRGMSAAGAVALGLGLAQLGEFSFIVAGLGTKLGVLPERATQVLVAVSMLSITLNPLLFRWAPRAVSWLEVRGARLRQSIAPAEPALEGERRTIVVGYGPVGKSLTELLIESGVVPTVIELNHDTVKRLAKAGIRAVFGDASRPTVLESAGIASADVLVFAASGSPEAVVRQARALRPELEILARTTYAKEADGLHRVGVENVVSAEVEVAIAMSERVLTLLGASADQIDRERSRVREELLGASEAAR